MSKTVLSHLAARFAAHPENIATEALGFLLRSSQVLQAALGRFLGDLGLSNSETLEYRTQATNADGTRPDLVGIDSSGNVRVTLEGKFWAGLTEAQPVGYIASLTQPGSVVLFITPAVRIRTIWPELIKRAQTMSPSAAEVIHREETRHAPVGQHVLAITSWRVILELLARAAIGAGDSARLSDIGQLEALCAQMDSEAFLPLSSEELTSSLGRRVVQFGNLASRVTDRLVRDGLASVQGLRATGGNGWYGRYVFLKGHGSLIAFDASKWSESGKSPLWLSVFGPGFRPTAGLESTLVSNNVPLHAFAKPGCHIPLSIRANAEESAVFEDIVSQINDVLRVLPSVEAGERSLPSDVTIASASSAESPLA